MEPARPSFSPAGAGGVLVGTLGAVIAVCVLVGWAAGAVGWGFLVGAILGIPVAIFVVYRRYRRSFG